MRSKERMKPFLEELKKYWELVPDMRFIQFIQMVVNSQNEDPFFWEEKRTLQEFEKWFNKEVK